MRNTNIILFFIATSVLFACGPSDDKLMPSRLLNNLEFASPKASLMYLDISRDISEEVNDVITKRFADMRVSAQLQSTSLRGKSGKEVSSDSFQLVYEETPLCNAQIRVTSNENLGKRIALANLPSENLRMLSDREVDSSKVRSMLQDYFQPEAIDITYINFDDAKNCYVVDAKGGMTRAQSLTFEANDVSYQAVVTAEGVHEASANFFDATGSAKVYKSNPVDATMKTFTLSNLVDDGTLENDYFTTSTTGQKAEETDYKFNYSTTDGRFDETSLYVHANEQLSFFQGLGYKWTSKDKLNIFVHAVVGSSVNNALYTPASGTRPPKIEVGDGDGIRLQNLPKDADVVRHELGHHIVFDNIKSTKGESLVLHEGLADFFAFAFAGDACLGESICPVDSPIGCEKNGQCLRTADNDYVLGQNTKTDAHFKSQFISGYLWDLRAKMDKDQFPELVLNGIGMMLEASGYHDFVLALLLAEKDMYDGKYCKTIYDGAVDRGLETYISDFSCSDLPSLSALDNAGGTAAVTETTRSNKKSGLFGCGVVAASQAPMGLVALLMVFVMPLFFRRKRNI